VLRLKGATNRKTKDESAPLMESWCGKRIF
jgi:hypothetical protein